MADQFTPTPVKTKDNGDVVAKIVDSGGLNVAGVDASGNVKVKSAANDGVDVGDVTVNNAAGASAVNIQDGGNSITIDDGGGSITVDGTVTATNPSVQTDDTAFTPGTGSVSMIGAEFDDTTPDSVDEGDGGAIRMSANRNLYMRIRDDAGNERGANVTAAKELNVLASAQPGVDIGDVTINNAAGAAAVNIQDGGNAITVDNGGTFAVQVSTDVNDNAAFTDGTTKVRPAGYIFDEVAGTALTENDAAAARIDSKRAQVLVIEDATTRGQRQAVSAAGAAAQNLTQVGGAAHAVTNPVFSRLTDGTNPLGTNTNPLVVTTEGGASGTLVDARFTSPSVAASGTANLDSANVGAGLTAKLLEITVSSSVRIKVDLIEMSTATTTKRTFFVDANDSLVYTPRDRDAITVVGAAASRNFRMTITNMDNAFAADVYGSFTYETV